MNGPATTAQYDLHLHTYWSYDASAELENHFIRATALGVRCMAITEHHVLDSLPYVVAACARYPDLCVIPSAELSVNTSIGAVDLLCYGFPLKVPASLQGVLDSYHEWQREMGEAMCKGLQALGYDYTNEHRLELLQSYRPKSTLDVQGATHVQNGLQRDYFLQRGFINNEKEYGEIRARAEKEVDFPPYPEVSYAIPAVKEVGAVVAIAHPHGYFAQGDEQRMDALRDECQLDGIECAHKGVPADFTPIYRAYCEKHGLFSTGGSDSHTDEDIETKFAAHGGPDEWLDELLERVGDRALNRKIG